MYELFKPHMNKTKREVLIFLTLAPGAPVAPRDPRPPRAPCGQSDVAINQLLSAQLDLIQCCFRIMLSAYVLLKALKDLISQHALPFNDDFWEI